MVGLADRHRACRAKLSDAVFTSSLIGRQGVQTSGRCQLIGVRSRFEERSWIEERDPGGTSIGGEEPGVGPYNGIHTHRPERFLQVLNVSIEECKGVKAAVSLGLKLCVVETSVTDREND